MGRPRFGRPSYGYTRDPASYVVRGDHMMDRNAASSRMDRGAEGDRAEWLSAMQSLAEQIQKQQQYWLLQQPIHKDHGPIEHRHRRLRSSATSEGPGVLPVLALHHAFRISRAPTPYPLPISPGVLSHTFSRNPTNPTVAGVSGISKGIVI